ncbi:MAG TPA: CocE/NonD family hydrolase [Candidatus Polarisedimenticolaceae bacterium]|nr:CocE/NonD family hydrolase [Candidatus Polarisedimenticolaceae bacterium]
MRSRRRRVLPLLVLLACAWAGMVAWLSQQMVMPPRPRISQSARAFLGAALRDTARGPVVATVVPPASTAGLRAGDRLVSLDGRPLQSAAALTEAVDAGGPGATLRLEARRGEDGVLVDVTLEERPVSPADLGLAFRDVAFPDPWKLTLRGWYLPPPPGTLAPAVVFGHGNAADRRHGLDLAWELHRRGFALLLLDFAGRGESDGEVITLGAREAGDLGAALDWLRAQPGVDRTRLCLAGRSMGAAAALLCAAARPEVRAVASDSAYADLGEVVDDALRARNVPPWLFRPALFAVAGFRAGYRPAEVKPVLAVARTQARLRLAHGTADREVLFRHAEELKEAAGLRATLVPLPGLGHNDARSPEEAAAVARFLGEAVR